MAAPIHWKIASWTIDNLLWDAAGTARSGVWKGLWATRKLFLAVAGAALLTRLEWVEHHPSRLAPVALIHFMFLLALIALSVPVGRWFRGSDKKSAGVRTKGPNRE